MKYNFRAIEKKWQKKWKAGKTHEPDLKRAKKPFYNLMMFPYPSAEGLHVGNMYAFTGSDVYGRMKRMQGYDVFEPIGLDGFGIHSENYAMKAGRHPVDQAKISEKNFYRQLESIGNGFAWGEKLETYDPEYYRTTQWIFTEMWRHGLAYRKKQPVNWCPSCKTVLADEQVIQKRQETRDRGQGVTTGVCERCDTQVIKKDLEQWFFRITNYAERLLGGLQKLDWAEKVKIAQRNWIGKSEGAVIEFRLQDIDAYPPGERVIPIYTTRPDTLFGVTFLAISSEFAQLLLESGWHPDEKVRQYIYTEIAKRSNSPIGENEELEKEGIFSGIHAVNPANNTKIPVWIVNYVLPDVGTGAIMAVPAHDERDFEFAKKYKLPIKQVIAPETGIRRENEEWRDGGCGVVFDPKVQKYAVARWSNGQFGLFAGGVERGEDEREGILREVTEESGLYDFAYVERIRKTFAHFYNPVKKVNRITLAACYLVVLKSSNARPLKHEDHETFEVGWAGAGEVLANLENYNREGNHDHWIDFLKQAVGRAIELGYDTVSDPKVFRASAYVGIGTLLDSGKFDSMPSEEARWKITEFAGGNKKIQYRLRDWLISRQRYWGPPIPMIHCESCDKAGKGEQSDMPGWYAVPKEDLPVKLPYVENFRPTGTGKSPLASVEKFYKARCPGCNGWARRETDVSDTFLDSAWYYIGYLLQTQNSKLKTKNWDRELIKKWLPVDMYIGGAEHSVLHLLYVRFIAKAFKDWGLVHFEEPMTTFRAHGLIVKDGAKMSKSKGNIVSPDFFIEKFGADTLRMYLMFLGPFEDGGDFRDQGILGPHRFLERVWKMGEQVTKPKTENLKPKAGPSDTDRQLHRAIKKVTEDIQGLHHNTAISTLMILLNEFEKQPVGKADFLVFLQLLAPFAPHITEELWQELNTKNSKLKTKSRSKFSVFSFQSIHNSLWPKFNPKLIKEETIELIIQVNGKLRGRITVSSGTVQADAERLALENPEVKKWVLGEPKKVIFVPDRMINFVV